MIAYSLQFQISSNHNIYLSRTNQNEFKEGQRVFVCGRLQPSSFRANNDKLLTRYVVRANGVYLFDDPIIEKLSSSNDESSDNSGDNAEDNAFNMDQNHVQLLANVASEVVNKEDHSTFALATHFTFT